MEGRHERTLEDGGDLGKTDAPRAPSLDEHTRSQDLQGHNPACSNSVGDVQYIDHERKIMKQLIDNSLQELFRSWTASIEKRFKEIETNVIKIQRQVQCIQQQLHKPQHLKRHESLISLQPESEDGCCEDCDNSSCYSSGSDDSYSAYLQRMQKYQEKFGARHMSLKPSRVMRQKRVSSRNSLSLPSNTIIL